ncbi:MAG: hypothetical protein KIT34_03545 [Cyanobacteria bacterium TGS_CYA1]|nr:hypothetical protein [Cyanobacteria bacterium TGS_CYA1]
MTLKTSTTAPLDNLILSFSCPVDWNSMDGDERERFCKQCSKNVYNVSDMSRESANKFLKERTDTRLCVKFYLRPDGTIKTDECPRIIKPLRNAGSFVLEKVSVALGIVTVMISNLIPAFAEEKIAPVEKPSVPPGFKYAGKIRLGGSCPYETRKVCDILLELNPIDKKERALQEVLKNEITAQRIITIETADELIGYYEKKQFPDRYFLAQMLKVNLRLEGAKYENIESDLEKLEIDQLNVADFLTAKAESLVKSNNLKEAEKLANYCLRICDLGFYIQRSKSGLKYPAKNNRWSVQLKPGTKYIPLIKEDTLKRLINVYTKIAPDVYVNPSMYEQERR